MQKPVEVKENKLSIDLELIPEEILGVKIGEATRKLLSEGKESPLLEGMLTEGKELKNAKVRIVKGLDGELEMVFNYQREQLIIPERIGEYKLTEEDKIKLTNGETTGPVTIKGQEVYLQVDNKLNSVSIKSPKEVSVKDIIALKHEKGLLNIAGYKPSSDEVKDLIQGKELSTKVFEQDGRYFAARMSLTDDDKGVKFTEITSLTPTKAKELIERLNVHNDERFTFKVIDDVTRTGSKMIGEDQDLIQKKNIGDENTKIVFESGAVVLENEYSKNIKDSFVKKGENGVELRSISESEFNKLRREEGFSSDKIVRAFKDEAYNERFVLNKEGNEFAQKNGITPLPLEESQYKPEEIKVRGDIEYEIAFGEKEVKGEKMSVDQDGYDKLEKLSGFKHSMIERDYVDLAGGDNYILNEKGVNLAKENNIKTHVVGLLHLSEKDQVVNVIAGRKDHGKEERDQKIPEVKVVEVEVNTKDKEKQDKLFISAVASKDFIALNDLKNQGYKPSENVVNNIEKMPGVNAKDILSVKTIFGIEPEKELKGEKNKPIQERENANQIKITAENKKQGVSNKTGEILKQGIEKLGNDM